MMFDDDDTFDEATNPGVEPTTTAHEPAPSLEHLESLVRGVAAVVGAMQTDDERCNREIAAIRGDLAETKAEVVGIKADATTVKRLVVGLCFLVAVLAIVAAAVLATQ